MTIEQLHIPRYKLRLDYPGNTKPVGYIFTPRGEEETYYNWCEEKDKYPEHFQKLEWWEERTNDEFPPFVKNFETGEVFVAKTRLIKEPRRMYVVDKNNKMSWVIIADLIPATEQEFYKSKNMRKKDTFYRDTRATKSGRTHFYKAVNPLIPHLNPPTPTAIIVRTRNNILVWREPEILAPATKEEFLNQKPIVFIAGFVLIPKK